MIGVPAHARGRLQKVAGGSTGADALTIDWTRDNRPALIETAGGTEERFEPLAVGG